MKSAGNWDTAVTLAFAAEQSDAAYSCSPMRRLSRWMHCGFLTTNI